jgi:hypothetical protein
LTAIERSPVRAQPSAAPDHVAGLLDQIGTLPPVLSRELDRIGGER